ncbi:MULTISPECIES: DUF6716 putative glycosyltransferase [unclassified Streptomyces]|uniref:DUF6716 putative glycosyltransferase n=1 Tax=unclassified Streptomyces TaxID=2593676 RepID=UPI00081F2A7C|nr:MULTISPECIES: DUF6716 putative glycosyltransferase [unclassified Streptomyces]MYR26709.1 hypothetical protein [Streptomyces sp. SID4945]SCD55341.1 hypothetical protein GA0115251_111932 [Streptomyces sp. TverLS-915]SCF09131.1 hypothetical protein GA0115257_106786 [Streptomyces sp. LcepLS]
MSISKPKPPCVAVLADSDTRWKWGALTAARVTGCEEPDGFLLRGRATPTARQLREVGVRAASLREVTANGFVRAMGETEYDVVVLALVGGGVQALVHGLRYAWQEAVKRPVLVTGYVGVVYEKLADGLLLRHGADVVLANSRDDAERFRAVYEGVGADSASVVECALPFLQGEPATGDSEGPVVFAVQPSVPERRADRLYLLRRAAQHARLHPGREVLVKLRSRPGEHTTHIEEQPYQKLARSLDLPPNCRLEYGHMGTILDTASLLVTVSSTAALEALHRGVPTAVLTDLGIREALGNHAFLGSGCLTSWDALDAGHLPKADPAWAARQGVASDRPYESAFDAARARIAALLARPQLPPLSPYYTLATAPGYLPGILARHHLAPDGSPLPGASSQARPPGPLKQVVRQAARGAYRHGVQRVAPVIRRMGDL